MAGGPLRYSLQQKACKEAAHAFSRVVIRQSADWLRLKGAAMAEILSEIVYFSFRFLSIEPDVQPPFRTPAPWAAHGKCLLCLYMSSCCMRETLFQDIKIVIVPVSLLIKR